MVLTRSCLLAASAKTQPRYALRSAADLTWLGVELDAELNANHGADKGGQISSEASRVSVFVIPTNEELLIARDTVRVVSGAPQRFYRTSHGLNGIIFWVILVLSRAGIRLALPVQALRALV